MQPVRHQRTEVPGPTRDQISRHSLNSFCSCVLANAVDMEGTNALRDCVLANAVDMEGTNALRDCVLANAVVFTA